jgi:hypothetical protein
MNAEQLLEHLIAELQECVDRTELTPESCTEPSDFVVLLGQKELAQDMLTKLTKWKQECDEAEREALAQLEEELLSQNRFCINGNCEE